MTDEGQGAPAPRRRRRRWFVLLAILVVLIAVFWIRRATRPAKPKPPPPVVTVIPARAERTDLPVYLDTIGTVTSLTTVAIASQVNGIVEAVRYTEGQLVERGTPLVDIDPRPFAAALKQAEGTLHRDLQLLAQARMDLARYREAWAHNAIAKQIYDDQVHVVRQAEGTVLADRGVVEQARINLRYASITSPIRGRVGLRLVDPGNLVTAQSTSPLVVITQMDPISVVFPISEDDLGQLRELPGHGEGIQVTAFDRARTRVLATGALRTIDNQIDTTTGTVRARAIFANQDGALFPNQFVNTRILVRTLQGVVTVPSSTIQRDGQKAFVYAVEGGRAHVVPVTVGASDGERTQVQGLTAGTRVANSSFEKLREGALVQLGDQTRQARPPTGGPR
ncbi:MAG: efflux RND transporter periplasmic adaptor subunit [Kofleriaceae bacterium]|nr:efflux RND transporter periplasmic adaptor subunit [Kofleriaceae bacterium]